MTVTGGSSKYKGHVFWCLPQVERFQDFRFPLLAYSVHRACSIEQFTFALLVGMCLVTFGAVDSNTSRDFERVISYSSLRVFQELVRELRLLYG